MGRRRPVHCSSAFSPPASSSVLQVVPEALVNLVDGEAPRRVALQQQPDEVLGAFGDERPRIRLQVHHPVQGRLPLSFVVAEGAYV